MGAGSSRCMGSDDRSSNDDMPDWKCRDVVAHDESQPAPRTPDQVTMTQIPARASSPHLASPKPSHELARSRSRSRSVSKGADGRNRLHKEHQKRPRQPPPAALARTYSTMPNLQRRRRSTSETSDSNASTTRLNPPARPERWSKSGESVSSSGASRPSTAGPSRPARAKSIHATAPPALSSVPVPPRPSTAHSTAHSTAQPYPHFSNAPSSASSASSPFAHLPETGSRREPSSHTPRVHPQSPSLRDFGAAFARPFDFDDDPHRAPTTSSFPELVPTPVAPPLASPPLALSPAASHNYSSHHTSPHSPTIPDSPTIRTLPTRPRKKSAPGTWPSISAVSQPAPVVIQPGPARKPTLGSGPARGHRPPPHRAQTDPARAPWRSSADSSSSSIYTDSGAYPPSAFAPDSANVPVFLDHGTAPHVPRGMGNPAQRDGSGYGYASSSTHHQPVHHFPAPSMYGHDAQLYHMPQQQGQETLDPSLREIGLALLRGQQGGLYLYGHGRAHDEQHTGYATGQVGWL